MCQYAQSWRQVVVFPLLGTPEAILLCGFCVYLFATFAWNHFPHAEAAKLKTRKKRKENSTLSDRMSNINGKLVI